MAANQRYIVSWLSLFGIRWSDIFVFASSFFLRVVSCVLWAVFGFLDIQIDIGLCGEQSLE
jgi:hypothetical protein